MAGSFRTAGGVSVQNIALWDGTSWRGLGDGLGAPVQALASDGTRLFAGGANVLNLGDQELGVVAQWDGQGWTRVGAVGPQGQVRTLQWHQGRLYAAGDFQHADGQPARGIAVFDGMGWSEVGGGLSDPLFPYGHALASDGAGLWVGGTFARAGSVAASRIARWDGAQWQALGAGVGRRSGTSATVVRAWTRLVTFTNLTEAVRFVDERSALEPRRFHRAVSPQAPGIRGTHQPIGQPGPGAIRSTWPMTCDG